MENKIKALFDFQRFQGNKRLAEMIAEAEQSLNGELSDEELSYVSAAGVLYEASEKEDERNGI